MKKFALLIPLSLGLALPAHAESERVIDPADVTKVYTQAALMLNGSSDIQFQGQVSGGLENGQQFALLAEATFVDESNTALRDPDKFGTEYSNSRVQYFHVFETGTKATPKVGLSLDYINTRTNIKNDLLSVGGVVAINPAYTGGFLVFPRAGLMTGSMEIPGVTSSKDDLTGYSLGLITAKHLGDSGDVAHLFDERNPAVKEMLKMAIDAATKAGKYVGICGQGPSDHDDLAEWLMEQGISSVSLNPDTVIDTWLKLGNVANK